MSILCSGEACAFGEAEGICMPGMRVCGEAEGVACGVCIPGIFRCDSGDADGVAEGICIPGLSIGIC
jgi:hypothetical protein